MDRKLFTLTEGTPLLTDMVAYGNASSAGNITVGNLRTLLAPTVFVKTHTVEIGTWNMVQNSQIAVTPAKPNTILEAIPANKIRGIRVMIRNDDESGGWNTIYSDFLSVRNGTQQTPIVPLIWMVQVTIFWESTFIYLNRFNGSVYANASYSKIVGNDGLSFNRGWLTFDYVD